MSVSPCPVDRQFVPLNPRPMLQSFDISTRMLGINEDIVVRLKWGQTEYKGRLISVDSYMNIQLSQTEEFIDGKNTGTLGEVLIRCNNVLWIGNAKGVEDKDVQMGDS
ncbi:LSM domain-containing protein [Trichophyton tonsurans CBS 112818]|nr:LSM domain-containing protein [Trichophyton tonsurans CBS 112818]